MAKISFHQQVVINNEKSYQKLREVLSAKPQSKHNKINVDFKPMTAEEFFSKCPAK